MASYPGKPAWLTKGLLPLPASVILPARRLAAIREMTWPRSTT
ncbi:hypothetical protein ACG04R_02820 [Roseateles sp. BYS78W]|uniref:Uncharacterized protein n=1 Tax=Pelomonas candidula TaxID=3299025 RepID=A0ABW7H6Q2_9BURK